MKLKNQENLKTNQKPEFSKIQDIQKAIENTGVYPVFLENRLFFEYFWIFLKIQVFDFFEFS